MGAVCLSLIVGGCQVSDFTNWSGISLEEKTHKDRPAEAVGKMDDEAEAERQAHRFSEFTDIPIPADAKLDLDELLVLGTEDGWIGRLPLEVGYDMTDMYSFYEREMPRFGWERISFVRAAVSTMTYGRDGRIATITLYDRTTGGSQVDFTVAPAIDVNGQTSSQIGRSGRSGPVRLSTQPGG